MKELLDFIKTNNGVLYFDEKNDCFVLLRGQTIEPQMGVAHCAFPACDDAGIIPNDVGPERVAPAILSLERFGP